MKKKVIYIVLLVGLLNILSLISLYSALHKGGQFFGKDILLRQTTWIVLGWLIAIIISQLNYRMFYDLALWVYFISLFFLMLVAILGTIKMGAQRWIQILGVTFQPAELAKLAALLITARNFSKPTKRYHHFYKDFFHQVITPFIPLFFLFIFIFIQPDLGTAVIIILLFLLMLIGCGANKKNILILLLIVAICIPSGWLLLKDYQKDRLLVFINPGSDPLGAGYTIIQSKIAIGSGGLIGKGFKAGTQNQLNFIPARHTDFIFTVFAEEWGFMGCMFLLAIYYFLLKVILDTAQIAKGRFAFVLSLGVFSLFFIHVFINISMVIGLLPVVGLPLLFFSYGGSYTLVNFVLIGNLLNVLKNTQ